SSILAGSVWGDHCSPISDTTIMSSLAASCDHIDHVRTQLPYALFVGIVSLVFGEIGAGLGLYPGWVGLLLGAGVLLAAVRFLGKPVEAAT
ncbi:MAG: Na+/H+ antiporter NhaC family protein, partial [Polyangiales bacterium]